MSYFYPVLIALCFNAFDFVSGLVAALKTKSLESAKMRDGLFKKVGFTFCYLLAFLLDKQGEVIGLNVPVDVLPLIVLYVVGTECVSIIENICKINEDLIPEKLRELFNLK